MYLYVRGVYPKRAVSHILKSGGVDQLVISTSLLRLDRQLREKWSVLHYVGCRRGFSHPYWGLDTPAICSLRWDFVGAVPRAVCNHHVVVGIFGQTLSMTSLPESPAYNPDPIFSNWLKISIPYWLELHWFDLFISGACELVHFHSYSFIGTFSTIGTESWQVQHDNGTK